MAAAPRPAATRTRATIRAGGEVLITLGLVVLLFVFYEIYVTDWISAGKQREATAALDEQWRNPRGVLDRPLTGEGIAKLSVPVFGSDFVWTVLQGTDQDTLAVGPGHYPDTAMPGQPGNFALGGHRVGKGARSPIWTCCGPVMRWLSKPPAVGLSIASYRCPTRSRHGRSASAPIPAAAPSPHCQALTLMWSAAKSCSPPSVRLLLPYPAGPVLCSRPSSNKR